MSLPRRSTRAYLSTAAFTMVAALLLAAACRRVTIARPALASPDIVAQPRPGRLKPAATMDTGQPPVTAPRPNIVWIVGEDMGPDIGAYGRHQEPALRRDPGLARTPNIDALARQGAVFTRAFTHAPVCAPSRSGLITGRYPTSIGTHHMRSLLIEPPPLFTTHLRQAGYFVAWPGKTDFNFDVPAGTFDSTARWVENMPRQPFFAYINLGMSHEGQVRLSDDQFADVTKRLTPADRHDPARVTPPPFYPDTPIVRRDVARYYDLVTAVDYAVGDVLQAIDRAGVADNTLVFYFGDHGRGLPRYKRWVYDTGIHVPLIVRWPGRVPAGSVREDLVAFVDFAPTVLSAADVPVPRDLQGQVFLGPRRAPARKYVYAARDRMDETYDRIRAVRTKRYKYIRNFHPELPYAQRIAYMEEMPTMREWRRLNGEGTLVGVQRLFFAPAKPREELYDTETDPYEVHDLASSARHRSVLEELRAELDRWMVEARDMGAIPEAELVKRGLVRDMTPKYQDRR